MHAWQEHIEVSLVVWLTWSRLDMRLRMLAGKANSSVLGGTLAAASSTYEATKMSICLTARK